MKPHHVTASVSATVALLAMACVQAAPFEVENPGIVLDTSFYEGRLPIHSSDGSFSTQLFTMDPATGAYTFGYDTGVGEHQSYRVETRSPDGTVTGRYGYVDPKGVLRIVDYVADKRGYRPRITTRLPSSARASSLVIGPIPSPILSEESRLKTRKIPFANPLLTASVLNNQAASLSDVDLAGLGTIGASQNSAIADVPPPKPFSLNSPSL